MVAENRPTESLGTAVAQNRGSLFLKALAGFLIVSTLLMLPLKAASYPPIPRISVEAIFLAGLMVVSGALSFRRRGWVAGVLAAFVVAILLLKLAIVAVRMALDRPLNLSLDWVLLSSVYDLSIGTFGTVAGTLLCVGGLVVVFLLWAAITWGLKSISSLAVMLRRPVATAAGVALVLCGGVLSNDVWPGWTKGNLAAIGNRAIVEQARMAVRTRRQQEEFRIEMNNDDLAAGDRSLPGLADVDVILAFVESYGYDALYGETLDPIILPRLRNLQQTLGQGGLHMASTWLESPTAGGQSWLSHASVLSGLWVDNNAKYQSLATGNRTTLIDLFERTGHASVAAMPAILWPWPEGEALGYDRIYKADDLGYQASPFNWVTMPDQFTFSAFERLERSTPRSDRPAVFAKIALISSHAPWTPIAELVDWSAIDPAGMVFDKMAQQGPTPAEVWSDPGLVRQHFVRSLDYVLAVVGSYAEEFVDDQTLLIVLGDHQPAPIVTGPGARPTVPIHVISGDERLVRPFFEAGFQPGLMPSEDEAALRMDAIRNLLVHGFADLDG